MNKITSRDNALLKRLRKLLASAQARREQGCTLLDGPHLIGAYLDRFGAAGVEVVVAQSRAERAEMTALLAQVGDGHSHVVDDGLFRALSPSDHPVGIVACASIPDLLQSGAAPGDALLLDGIQDPGNVGALLRTACAAGFTEVHLSAGCADPWSPKCLRGGMGAQFHLRLHEDADLDAVLRAHPGVSVACDARARDSLYDLPLSGPLAVLMGAEGAGLRDDLVRAATHRCRIPMAAGMESLNVGVAAAVVMYEWVRRRTGVRV